MRTTDSSKMPPQGQATAMFVGATRYSGPFAMLTTMVRWRPMVRDMKRMRGYRWHTIYWQFPFTLGTIAFFEDRDAMLRFARSRHHRWFMDWVVDGDKNASAGFIRLYNAESAGYSNGIWRAEEDGPMARIDTFTPTTNEKGEGPRVKRG